MAYRVVSCPSCRVYLGTVHGYESRALIRKHFRKEHSVEFKELKEAAEYLKGLADKYSISVHTLGII